MRLFAEAFEKLLKAVERQSREIRVKRIDPFTYALPEALAAEVRRSLAEWEAQGKARRLWQRDASLWTGRDEAQWLGWLGITNDQLAHVQRFARIREAARSGGFSHVLLLGMGGSSLGPEVMRRTFGRISGFPELHVLDSTDPAQVKALEGAVDLAHTLFIVSSKSGSTLEPNIFKQYFFERVAQVVGRRGGGPPLRRHHRSSLEDAARRRGRRLPPDLPRAGPTIGGRYSVLSDFGLVPAAAMGVDVAEFLERTEAMVNACMPSVRGGGEPRRRARDHPGRRREAVRPRQGDDRRRRRASRASAPGSSSCSPSRRARTGRA